MRRSSRAARKICAATRKYASTDDGARPAALIFPTHAGIVVDGSEFDLDVDEPTGERYDW